MKNLNERSYNEVLNEAYDYFQSQGISVIGEGYKEVASNAALFESYVDQLTEGSTADGAATMAQLMANTNANILRESSMTGIQPIASLSMPVIRKLWPKFALKDALKTEVAKTPRFVVTYTKPYMYKGDVDKKVYLPRDLRTYTLQNSMNEALNKKFIEETVEVETGKANVVIWDTKVTDTPSAVKVQPLDELVIVSAKTKVGEVSTEHKIGKRLGVYGNGVYELNKEETKVQLIVQFDGAARKATFAAVGTENVTVTLVVRAGVSSEYNEESWSVGFDIARQDIDIPTGQHLNAPLPVEALNDMMALYQIDGTKETVDLMTNVFAQKLDLEVLQFIKKSFAGQPNNEAFFGEYNYISENPAADFTYLFDCKPAAGFAGSPKAWREEIKPLIDHAAQKIKNNTYLTAGTFTIVCNPLDAQILANIDWQYRSGQGGNMEGVDVDYSVGTYVGANAYKVISSTNVPAGQMFILFTPSGDTQMTYKYYPYSFSTEMGYVDPNRSRVPSIMMTKRHTFHEFMPAVAAIMILNNDGKGHFAQYINTNAVDVSEISGYADNGDPITWTGTQKMQ
jgi:hypothetical protein